LKFDFTIAHITRSITVFGIIVSIGCINNAYGQSASENAFPQFPTVPSSSNNTSGTEVTTKSIPIQQQLQSEGASYSVKHGVRITAPVRDQQVATGAILTISGVSKDNATSDCHVNINVNHIRPYQNTSAAGPSGPNDYSNWTFSLTPKYTVIKQGLNEITAKFFCNPNPDVASFYSMNVTGISPAGVKASGGGQTKMAPPMQATTNSSNTTATVTNQTRATQ
jgi:hypothetical protein